MIVQIYRNIGWDQVSHSNCTLMLRTVFPFLSFYILEGTLLHLVTLWHLATFFFSLLWKANVHGPLGWKMSYNLPIFPHCCFLNRIQIDILLQQNDGEWSFGCDDTNLIWLYIIWEKQSHVNLFICYMGVFGQSTLIGSQLTFI